ncbi:MAG: hypothetical protein OJF55_000899 [Rhodanobacteraceae bacterium]|jgi:hypothetical protein|nr:MAG: hypothetical protein OJF55_000899 [Rhodanobacteraceae bacterium]
MSGKAKKPAAVSPNAKKQEVMQPAKLLQNGPVPPSAKKQEVVSPSAKKQE